MSVYSDIQNVKSSDSLTYQISLSDTSSTERTYRSRLFFTYGHELSYLTDSACGLMADIDGSTYDDWNSSFRPPRIDNATHNFNTELIIPLTIGTNTVHLNGIRNGVNEPTIDVSGESYFDDVLTHHNPASVLIESLVSTVSIKKLYNVGNTVYVETSDPHCFGTGDAITISGLPDGTGHNGAENHILGENASRLMGTFTITVTSQTAFTYVTGNYSTVSLSYTDVGNAEYWQSVYYSDKVSIYTASESDKMAGIVTVVYGNDTVPFDVGDYVSILYDGTSYTNASVLSIDGNKVRVNAGVSLESSGTATLYYSPRVPVYGIPVNYPYVSSVDDIVDNRSVYNHAVNTFKNKPSIDTYFTSENNIDHDSESHMIVKSGKNMSVACLKFDVAHLNTSTGAAKIGLYISDMNYSGCSFTMYQMNSSSWNGSMSYDEINELVTSNPISYASVENPKLDGYNHYVEFDVDDSIVVKWLSGNPQYPPCVAVYAMTSGSPEVTFNSSENAEFPPYFIISAGEKAALDPDLFDIQANTTSAIPGETVRLTVNDYDGSFGNYVFENEVYFGSFKGTIVSGNANYIDVVVPDDVDGSVNIVVYTKQTDGTKIAITNPLAFYVKNDAATRNKKLAERKAPGYLPDDGVSGSAWYSRDIGFSGFSEITDETNLIQNVYSILLTNRGERLFNSEFGSTIESRIFSLSGEADDVTVIKECIKLIGIYEPRVSVDPDNSTCEFDDGMNALKVNLCLVLPSARREYVYLTFKDRGQK